MEDERDLKTKIVSKAKELQELIFSCNDDDFVDSVVTALKYNSYIEDEDLDDGNNYYGTGQQGTDSWRKYHVRQESVPC